MAPNSQREIVVKVFNNKGELRWRERVTVNSNNYITFHHGFGCLIDEGEEGKPIDSIFKGQFTEEWTNEVFDEDAIEPGLFPVTKLLETVRLHLVAE